MPRIRGIGTLALGLTFLLVAGCTSAPGDASNATGDADDAADGNLVTMKSMAFSPKTLEVKVGETVTWVNKDSVLHTVSADDPNQWGTPGSGDDTAQWMKSGATWNHTFMEPGTYQYYCKPHASGSMGHRMGMVGTIIVEA